MDASYWVFTSLLIAVVAQRLPPPGVPVQPLPQQPIGNDYGFRYSVNDFNGNEHSHQQQKSGHVVRGQYKVLLPDGRLQTVTYVADENGYRAKVDYTPARPGEATTAGHGGPPFEPAQPPIVRPPLLPPVIQPPVLFGRTSVQIDPQAEQLAALVAAPSSDAASQPASSTTSSTSTSTISSTTTARSTARPSDSQRGARQFINYSQDRVVRPADPPRQGRLQYPTYYGEDSQLKFSAYPYAYTQHS